VAADTADDQESVEVEIELDLERLDDLELELDEDLPDENAGTETDSETITVSEPEDSGADILTMAAADVEDLDTISEVAAPSDFAETYTEDFGLNLQGETDDTEQLDSGYVLTPFDEIDEGIPVALEEGDDGDDSMAAAGIDTMTAEPEALFEAPEPSSLDFADGEEETEHADEAEEPEEIEELEILDDNDESEEIVELAGLEEEEGGVIEDVQELDDLAEVAPDSGTPAAKVDFAAALNLESELEEAQFFLQQGLYDDAEKVVMTLLEYRPGLPELIAKLDEISDARQAAESELASTAFVDLMADLQDEDLLAATDFLNTFEDSPVDDELSQKLVSELDSSDTESHYNLGIAYKEMGLYDEAIAEFQKAAQDPVRSIDCIALTGQCQLEAGDNAAALATFRSGLSHEHINDKGRMTLNFELGMLHQLNGELLEALECFQLVAEKDSFFRDVAMLIKNLRKVLGLDGPEDDDGPQGNRDRVSYV
jgi:tetratricopeptide (TPR) repeat protein